MKNCFYGLLSLGVSLTLISCGGSSGSSSATTSSGTGTVSHSDAKALPSADASSYDYSLAATSSSSSLAREAVTALEATNVREFSAAPGKKGGFCRAGCEMRMMTKHMMEPSLQVEAMKCRLKVMIENKLFDDPTAKPGVANEYAIQIPSDPRRGGGPGEKEGTHKQQSGNFQFRFRTLFESDALKLHMCFPNHKGDLSLAEEMIFGKDSKTGNITTTIRHRRSNTFGTEGQAQGPGGFKGGTFKDQMVISADVQAASDGDATFSAQFKSVFQETGGAENDGHLGKVAFKKVTGDKHNTLRGSFKDNFGGGFGGGHQFDVLSEWDSGKGVAKFKGTGKHPGHPCFDDATKKCCFDFNPETGTGTTKLAGADGLCTFSHTRIEAFNIEKKTRKDGKGTVEKFVCVDKGDVSWFDKLNKDNFDAFDSLAQFAFDTEWNCGDDKTIKIITKEQLQAIGSAMNVCDKLEEKKFHDQGFQSCENDENTADVDQKKVDGQQPPPPQPAS